MRLTQRVDDTVGTAAKERYNERGGGGERQTGEIDAEGLDHGPLPR